MRKRIGLRDIAALQPGALIWDSAVIGFAARRQHGTAVTYCLKFRTTEGRQRWLTIGRHGAPWTPDTARTEAKRILGLVAQGGDPAGDKRAARKALTVAELCERYMADAKAGVVLTRFGQPKKTSTLLIDRGRIERHIVPVIGSLSVAAVTNSDIVRLRDAVATGKTAGTIKTGKQGLARVTGGRGTATRVLRLLGGVFSFAVSHGMRADNPVRGVKAFKDGLRTRSLSAAEYKALGAALQAATDMWPPAVAAARFLCLSGWRVGEVLNLKGAAVDLTTRTARLGDTKTGYSVRPLSQAACDVLQELLPLAGDLAFPSVRGNGPMVFKKNFRKIRELGKLPADVSPHVLRHSFASTAANLNYSDSTIAALLGHKGRSVTSRYSHHADPVLLAAADAVANVIRALLDA